MFLKLRSARGVLVPIVCVILVGGCTIHEGDTRAPLSAARLIVTPPSHYSTQKGRYLGEKYQEKLERLIEMITSNRITSKLQFANNLGSSGGIGFFTHSAVKAPDERFLEVVLGTEENLQGGEYSEKVARLFSLYGRELLLILASDLEIYNDREVSGYGLNFTWRSGDSRRNTERAIVYFSKQKVRAFLREDVNNNMLLADAVIFVIGPDAQANLLSYRAQEPAPDVRAPIKEQVLLPEPAKEEREAKRVVAERPINSTEPNKPTTRAREIPAGENKWTSSSKSETASKPIIPDLALKTEEEIVRDQEVGRVAGGNSEPVGKASSIESGDQTDKSSTRARGLVEATQPGPRAGKSSQPQAGAETTQLKLEDKKSEVKAPEVRSLVELSEDKEQNELRLDLPDSQPRALTEGARPNEASKSELERHALPAPGSAEVPLSSAEAPKPDSAVERLSGIASVTKINPNAHSEMAVPVPKTLSGLQNAPDDSVERHSVLAHAKPVQGIPDKSFFRPVPKSLEGYIIQVSFKDRSEARSWADTFEQRGYAVSMTEASGGHSLRVRIGNFRLRDDAERQLKSIREDGFEGIILNLPQAYRPEVRSSLP